MLWVLSGVSYVEVLRAAGFRETKASMMFQRRGLKCARSVRLARHKASVSVSSLSAFSVSNLW